MYCKTILFLVIDATFAWENSSRFRKNLLEGIWKLIMTTDKIRDEKLQYDSNREATKMPTLSSGKIDKYEYLRGEEILFSNQRQIKEQGKFTYCPLGKTSEKQIKTIEHQWEKQIKAIEDHRKQLLKSSSEKESCTLLKQKEIFEELANKRMKCKI